MANSVTSGWFTVFVEDALTNIAALDLELETHKTSIWQTSGTIANTVYDEAAADGNALTGGTQAENSTGWPTDGVALSTTEVTISPANSVMFDAADYSQADTTFSSSDFACIYADALAGDNALVGIKFSSAVAPSAGTFTITWDSLGIATIDCLP